MQGEELWRPAPFLSGGPGSSPLDPTLPRGNPPDSLLALTQGPRLVRTGYRPDSGIGAPFPSIDGLDRGKRGSATIRGERDEAKRSA